MEKDDRSVLRRDEDIKLALERALLDERVRIGLAAMEMRIADLEDDRRKAVRWGILALGSAVMAMGSWIWSFITGHLK